jgi:hypothetical protein
MSLGLWQDKTLRARSSSSDTVPRGFTSLFAGAPAPDEFGYQLAGGLVGHFPMAREHDLGTNGTTPGAAPK